MLVRVVTVAEEHPRSIRHRADPLRRNLVHNRPLHYPANGHVVQGLRTRFLGDLGQYS